MIMMMTMMGCDVVKLICSTLFFWFLFFSIQVRTFRANSVETLGILYFVAIVTVLVSVAVAIILALTRHQPAVMATAPKIGAITCLGGVTASAAVFCLTQPVTTELCQSWLWLTTIAYSLMFASLFFKTYRYVFPISLFFIVKSSYS
jgi:hypothetical protein